MKLKYLSSLNLYSEKFVMRIYA